ncbi:hypothetical protein FKM82_022409 [Ascaphus truei]
MPMHNNTEKRKKSLKNPLQSSSPLKKKYTFPTDTVRVFQADTQLYRLFLSLNRDYNPVYILLSRIHVILTSL